MLLHVRRRGGKRSFVVGDDVGEDRQIVIWWHGLYQLCRRPGNVYPGAFDQRIGLAQQVFGVVLSQALHALRDIAGFQRVAAFPIKAEALAAWQPVHVFGANDLDQLLKAAEAGRNFVRQIQKAFVMQGMVELGRENDRRLRSQFVIGAAMGRKACCGVGPQQPVQLLVPPDPPSQVMIAPLEECVDMTANESAMAVRL